MPVNYSSLASVVQGAQEDLHTILAEAYLLFDTLRQFKLPDLGEEEETTETAEDDQEGPRKATRRLSVAEISAEGQRTTEGLMIKLGRHVDAYALCMVQLREAIVNINTMCADGGDWPPHFANHPMTSEEMTEFHTLSNERDQLTWTLRQKNHDLRLAMEGMRDLSMMMGVVGSKFTLDPNPS